VITHKDALKLAKLAEVGQTVQGRKGPIRVVAYAEDGPASQVAKYVPAEIVTAYLAMQGFVLSGLVLPDWATLVIFVFFVGLVCAYTYFTGLIPGLGPPWLQISIAVAAFFVWALAVGWPFDQISGYNPLFGAVAATLFLPVIALVSKITGK
jgi:hypothetical protein